ncbi:MAG: hypothetical protein M1813_001361 [Trichoglossum hirsutum]|nr:MAG: hypothetical protein M1813_001361 [Trichoglossum hirsutum]
MSRQQRAGILWNHCKEVMEGKEFEAKEQARLRRAGNCDGVTGCYKPVAMTMLAEDRLYVRASSSSSSKPPTWEALVQCSGRETTIVLADPLREEQHNRLRWYLEDYYANSPFQIEKATQSHRGLHECGASLLRMLDLPRLLQDIEVPLPFLHVFVESSADDDGAFNRILWETLELPECYSAVARGLVVIRSVRRRVDGTPPAPPRIDSCFRILLIAARNLSNRREPDHRLISRSLVSTIESVSQFRAVELELVRPGTFFALKYSLQSRASGYYDLIHFDVHRDVILSEGKRA